MYLERAKNPDIIAKLKKKNTMFMSKSFFLNGGSDLRLHGLNSH